MDYYQSYIAKRCPYIVSKNIYCNILVLEISDAIIGRIATAVSVIS